MYALWNSWSTHSWWCDYFLNRENFPGKSCRVSRGSGLVQHYVWDTYQVCVGVVTFTVLHAFIVDAIKLVLQANTYTQAKQPRAIFINHCNCKNQQLLWFHNSSNIIQIWTEINGRKKVWTEISGSKQNETTFLSKLYQKQEHNKSTMKHTQ